VSTHAINDVSEIREELARIASELGSERQDAEASRLDVLNSTFFTTTTDVPGRVSRYHRRAYIDRNSAAVLRCYHEADRLGEDFSATAGKPAMRDNGPLRVQPNECCS
jgi:hypothetical protein